MIKVYVANNSRPVYNTNDIIFVSAWVFVEIDV